jgi:hypothetical protein
MVTNTGNKLTNNSNSTPQNRNNKQKTAQLFSQAIQPRSSTKIKKEPQTNGLQDFLFGKSSAVINGEKINIQKAAISNNWWAAITTVQGLSLTYAGYLFSRSNNNYHRLNSILIRTSGELNATQSELTRTKSELSSTKSSKSGIEYSTVNQGNYIRSLETKIKNLEDKMRSMHTKDEDVPCLPPRPVHVFPKPENKMRLNNTTIIPVAPSAPRPTPIKTKPQ